MEIVDDTKSSSFIHFGCWNNLNIKRPSEEEAPVEAPVEASHVENQEENKGFLDKVRDTFGINPKSVVNPKSEPTKIVNGGLKRVMDKLKTFTEVPQNNVDFVIVAGDNYYPDKYTVGKNKKKIIRPDKLEDGINLLPLNNDKIKYYMILGNHDLETNINEDKKTLFINDESTQEPVESCTILETQQQIIQDKKNDNKNIDYLFFKIKKIDTTMVIMFDTSIFSAMKDAISYLPCYKKFLLNDQGFKNYIRDLDFDSDDVKDVEIIREYVSSCIIDAVNSDPAIKYVIFSGHHPIYSHKYKMMKIGGKKKKDKKNVTPVPDEINDKKNDVNPVASAIADENDVNPVASAIADEKNDVNPVASVIADEKKEKKDKEVKTKIVTDEIEDFRTMVLVPLHKTTYLRKLNYYYLCADLHLYQYGKITISLPNDNSDPHINESPMVIEQYIVGTGGTPLDPLYTELEQDIDSMKHKTDLYENVETIRNFGFLHCVITNITNTPPTFTFIQVDDEIEQKGSGRRNQTRSKSRIRRKPKYIKAYTRKNKRKNKSKKRKTFPTYYNTFRR